MKKHTFDNAAEERVGEIAIAVLIHRPAFGFVEHDGLHSALSLQEPSAMQRGGKSRGTNIGLSVGGHEDP